MIRNPLTAILGVAFAVAAWSAAWALPAWAQTFGSPNLVITAYKSAHISTDATTVIKSGPGILHTICYNTPGASATATVYDNTSAAAPILAVISLTTSDAPQCLTYDLAFTTGLTIVTAVATTDLTVSFY